MFSIRTFLQISLIALFFYLYIKIQSTVPTRIKLKSLDNLSRGFVPYTFISEIQRFISALITFSKQHIISQETHTL